MRLFGKAISGIAKLILGHAWRNLARDLGLVYARYCVSVRSQIPAILVTTLIAAEDHRFYRHYGVDPIAIARAIWRLTVRRTWDGGSTIEQQLVRTVTGRYERRLRRKVREVLLASLVRRLIPKSEIPGVYLCVAYFGWRMNGIQAACRRLGFELIKITPHQAASIVARLKYPEPKFPSSERAQQIFVRRRHILSRVAKCRATEGVIDFEVEASAAVLNL